MMNNNTETNVVNTFKNAYVSFLNKTPAGKELLNIVANHNELITEDPTPNDDTYVSLSEGKILINPLYINANNRGLLFSEITQNLVKISLDKETQPSKIVHTHFDELLKHNMASAKAATVSLIIGDEMEKRGIDSAMSKYHRTGKATLTYTAKEEGYNARYEIFEDFGFKNAAKAYYDTCGDFQETFLQALYNDRTEAGDEKKINDITRLAKSVISRLNHNNLSPTELKKCRETLPVITKVAPLEQKDISPFGKWQGNDLFRSEKLCQNVLNEKNKKLGYSFLLDADVAASRIYVGKASVYYQNAQKKVADRLIASRGNSR